MSQNIQTNIPIKIYYGHDGECVLMGFSQSIQNNRMTIEQTDEMIRCLQEAKETLQKSQAEKQ